MERRIHGDMLLGQAATGEIVAGEVRYIVTKRWGVLSLTRGSDGFWRDGLGTIFAYSEYSSVDDIARCGVGFFSLPTWHPLTNYCARHDWVYQSAVFQAFHTRKEADKYLRDLISYEKSLWRYAAWPFYYLTRIFGRFVWEED
jgi:hypothetical protein